MKVAMATRVAAAFLLAGVFAGEWAFGNGGPFVVKHPNGDPAAKGVLARLDPTLKPAQETRLQVLEEDLTIRFVPELGWDGDKRRLPPLVDVTASYKIENATGETVKEDFGFPILRGIFLKVVMFHYPDVGVHVDQKRADPTVISNSAIYGMIRQQAREVIEKGIAQDAKLARLVAGVRDAWTGPPPSPQAPRPAVAGGPRRREDAQAGAFGRLPLGPRVASYVCNGRSGMEGPRRRPPGRVRKPGCEREGVREVFG